MTIASSRSPFALPCARQLQLRTDRATLPARPHLAWHAAGRAAAVPWRRRRRRRLPTVVLASRGAADDAVAQAAKKPDFRLWSNLSPELKHEPGTVWGAAALITGTTVGAGILALPAKTAASGFVASSAALTAFSLFSIVTGLLVAEVNINTLCEVGGGRGVSLSSMAQRTLGAGGARAVSAAYLLIHYSLLVAYIAKAGETLENVAGVPAPAGSAVFAAAFTGLCFATRPATLNAINTALVGVFVASFLGLAGLAAADLQPQQLAAAHWEAVPDALPVIALAYVYQNVVPVVCSNLEGDVAKIRQAVTLGVLSSWLMFELWLAAVLGSGSMSSGGAAAAAGALEGGAVEVLDPLAVLRGTGGGLVTPLIDTFTLLAVFTSAIGFCLGLTDFFADALKLPTGSRQALPYLLTVGPPLVCAVAFPDIFFGALDFAGAYGVLSLFGVIPAAMVWSERYGGTTLSRLQIVPGGAPLLLLVAGTAAGIIGREALLAAGQL